ncbi:MAG: hypothetical protein JWL84_1810 [Rhodospirillales bacterium]|jgi:hypothetical protein|nr:hypothetical protein [Rhodospirillales bacterium]
MLLDPISPEASAYLNCDGGTTEVGRPREFNFFVTLRSTEWIARRWNQSLLPCCG